MASMGNDSFHFQIKQAATSCVAERELEWGGPASPVVIDTNVALDLLLFRDASVRALHRALHTGALRWLATSAMRDELARVLDYPQLSRHVQAPGCSGKDMLAAFARLSQLLPAAAPAPVRCADTDDQMFIDLAVAHRAVLFSKDNAVIALRQRLAPLGVRVQRAMADA